MKYIVEIKPEYEDSFKGLMILGAKDSNLFIDVSAVDDLEELTADYINEHFGDLQDTAYQRGLEDGKAVHDKGCEGCKYEGNSKDHSPCDYCCNCYSSQWAAKDNKFEFGDEIIDSDGVKGCVISKDNEESNTIYALFDGYRTPQCITQRSYRKTGKRYDIDKILDEMKGTGADDDTY